MVNGVSASGRIPLRARMRAISFSPKKILSLMRAGAVKIRKKMVYRHALKKVAKEKKRGKKVLGQDYHFARAYEFHKLLVPNDGDRCALYARLAAQRRYHMVYFPSDAWTLARENKSIWKKPSGEHDPFAFVKHAKPGHILGIYNPRSGHKREDRPYTHVVMYVGMRGGEPLIMHRLGMENRLEPLSHLLDYFSQRDGRNPRGERAEVREVIGPRGE